MRKPTITPAKHGLVQDDDLIDISSLEKAKNIWHGPSHRKIIYMYGIVEETLQESIFFFLISKTLQVLKFFRPTKGSVSDYFTLLLSAKQSR